MRDDCEFDFWYRRINEFLKSFTLLAQPCCSSRLQKLLLHSSKNCSCSACSKEITALLASASTSCEQSFAWRRRSSYWWLRSRSSRMAQLSGDCELEGYPELEEQGYPDDRDDFEQPIKRFQLALWLGFSTPSSSSLSWWPSCSSTSLQATMPFAIS